jgi:hypothetical protein
MASQYALAGLSLSSMSTRILAVVVLLALIGLLLVKRAHDARSHHGDDPVDASLEETDASPAPEPDYVDPRSLSAPVASVPPPAQVPSPVLQHVGAPAAAVQPATPAARPTPPAPVPLRPSGLFAPAPDGLPAAGGRAPGATVLPRF